MATQENIALSSPTLQAEETGFIRAVSKAEKSEKKTAADILSALKLVEEQLTHAKEGVTSTKEGDKIVSLEPEAPKHESLEDAMAQMSYVLQMLQAKLAKYHHKAGKTDSQISEALVKDAKKSRAALKKLEKKLERKRHKDILISVFSLGLADLDPKFDRAMRTLHSEIKEIKALIKHHKGTQAFEEFLAAMKNEKKKGKKSNKDLSELIKLVETQLSNGKSGKTSSAPSHESFEKAMAEMTFMLQLLQVKLAKYSNNQASMNESISKSFVKSAEASLKDLQKKLAEIAKKEHDHTIWSDITKACEYVVAAVTAVAGVLLCQPELLVIAALSFLSASGLLSDATKGLAKFCEFCGMSESAANTFAAIAMCVVIVVASVAACDPEEAGEELVNTGIELTDSATSGSEDVAEEVEAESSNGLMDKLSNTKFGKVLKALGPRGRIAIMSSATALSSTNLVQDIYVEAGTHGMTPEEVKQWKKNHAKQLRDIEIIVEAVTLVATIIAGLGAGMSGAGKGALNLSSNAANIARVGQKIGLTIGILGSAVGQIGEGLITIQQGKLEKGLSKDKASLDVLKVLTEMLNDSTSATQRQLASEEKTQKTSDRSQMKLNAGIKQFAENAVYFSPV